jgi:hypothetical protein
MKEHSIYCSTSMPAARECVEYFSTCVRLQLACVRLQLACVRLQLACVCLQLACVRPQLACVRLQLACVRLLPAARDCGFSLIIFGVLLLPAANDCLACGSIIVGSVHLLPVQSLFRFPLHLQHVATACMACKVVAAKNLKP